MALPAAIFVAAAVLSWLISRRMAGKITATFGEDGSNAPTFPVGKGLPIASVADPSSSRPAVPNTAFNPKSPYRVVNAEVSEAFLSYLAEVQSDLVQAARDGAWDVDFDEITTLNKQAGAAQQTGKHTLSIRARAKAIDLLMREMYQRSRST